MMIIMILMIRLHSVALGIGCMDFLRTRRDRDETCPMRLLSDDETEDGSS
jgi:hypothetical protein